MVLRLETQNEGYIVRPSSGFGGSVEKSYMLQQPQGRNDFHMILKYSQTMRMAMRAQTNGGIFYLLPNIAVRLVHLIPLLFLWSVLSRSGVETGMTLKQMLSYTYLNAILADLLVVQTFASSWCYEGELHRLYLRPTPIFGGIVAETVGGWIPMLLFFSLPLLCAASFLGISVLPASPWFFPSLLLCISLGFAIDFLFACVAIELRGISWLAHVIRTAIVALFSGTVLPFRLLPFGLARVFELQPFGSLGGAPLALFVGTARPERILLAQVFWNLTLWPAAILWFCRSRERLVSFGG